jgi:NAD(P)H-flavin reductase
MNLELIEKRKAGDALHLLRFSAPPFLLEAFTMPGQYAILEPIPEEKPGFFAIASAPQDPYLEFLIKEAAGPANAIIQMSTGDSLICKSIEGKGFPLSLAPEESPIHMFSMGSGYAPFRALIRSAMARSESHCQLHLWQAAFRITSVPLLDELVELERKGVITLHLCLDDQQDATDHPYFAGQIDNAIGPHIDSIKNSRMLWIGSRPFGEALSVALERYGIDIGALASNY